LDFYRLAMPADTTVDDRVAKCIEHQKAEVAARNATGKTDYFIPKTYGFWNYERRIFVIIKPGAEWEQGGEFLQFRFDI
jgi:hypothetical protein